MMRSSPAMGAHFFQVHELVGYIRELLTGDPILSDVWVTGEISELTQSAAGHVYFTVRDASTRISSVMWRSQVRRQSLPLLPGFQALVHGSIDIYDQRSTYQLIADVVLPGDAGRLRAQFEALRLRLEEEGLFAPERKRPLPRIPQRIGIVTSESGAVIHDMMRVWERRYCNLEIVLAPSVVQGEDAPRQVVSALRRLNDFHATRAPLDLIIVARGGGSPEELAAFNDERIARAIFGSPVPIISAIGHEVDYTIADFVADLRAPTPSAAAEIVVPAAEDLCREIDHMTDRIRSAVRRQLDESWNDVRDVQHRLERHSPSRAIDAERRAVDDLVARATRAIHAELASARTNVEGAAAQLAALSPELTMRRGYAVCTRVVDGVVLTSPAGVGLGDLVGIRLASGQLIGEVLERNEPKAAGARKETHARE